MAEQAPIFNDFIVAEQSVVEDLVRRGIEAKVYISKPFKEMPRRPFLCVEISSPTDSVDDLQVFYLPYDDGLTFHSPIHRAKTFEVDTNTMLFKKSEMEGEAK